MNSVIILAFIGGMRSFDLIWAMTGGGPGFATDVVASIVYKQYAAGFYGLSTAGNVVMFILIAVIVFPLQKYLLSKEVN
jgi:raffinose/stachyose/melibiose transport system permease protein